MKLKNLPLSIAVIPDGNRRWALSHKLSIMRGYSYGVSKFIDFSEWCLGYGINSISVWAFSTENFRRNTNEVSALFGIYKKVAKDRKIIKRLHENATRLNIIGNRSLMPKDLLSLLRNIERETMQYTEHTINMLIGYGGRDDILHAVKGIFKNIGAAGRINDEAFRNYLISNSIPDIDFIIRTSGEQRLSGFMPWQSAYSELYFSKRLWPDFTRQDLHRALVDYSFRKRRFGK